MMLSAWGSAPDDVYFAGGSLGGTAPGLALHFDGNGWTDLNAPTANTLWWVFGKSVNDIFFVGEMGTILHWGGKSFVQQQSGATDTLYGIWGAADDDLWAVGGTPDASSTAIHFDGTSWTPASLPQNGGAYFKVWGSAANDVFVVGQYGKIYHFDGRAWTEQQSGAGKNVSLFTVAGRSSTDVYAVGGQGTAVALHYDGSSWSPVPGIDLSLTSGLSGVSVAATGDVSVTGLAGAKFRGTGSTWIDDSSAQPRSDLHGTWIAGPNDLFAVGGNLNGVAGSSRHGVIAHYGGEIPAR